MKQILLTATLLACLSGTALADQLFITEQGADLQNINRPQAGMNQAQVEQFFNAPFAIKGPVGKPPITVWQYQDFSVYFEGDTVLHTVLHARVNTP